MNRLVVVLVVLGIGLALLVFNNDTGQTFGMDNDEFGRLLYLLPIAGLLSVGVLNASRGNLPLVLRQIAIWLAIILALVSGYLYRDDFRRFGERLLAGLMPGRAVVVTTSEGGQEIILHKSMNGHFEANTTVNGIAVHMLVDTGASSVVLSANDARKIGLHPENLNYTRTVMTANGPTKAAHAMLSELSIGPISRTNIPALVAGDGQLDQSLLGMSFLSTLGSLQMQTDELRLRDW